ncbi:hypothetical protein BHE74_00013218 [Ensete ventricosum]|nr:hypothetical protein GW17_00046327 [Ensete ventricosum]RWW78561.1 hypothetical protein BHE74_00013218 [Ensete ventricosum]RZS03701.1 hypothetical protein BHM03_00033925 [Ensete ventricosum]
MCRLAVSIYAIGHLKGSPLLWFEHICSMGVSASHRSGIACEGCGMCCRLSFYWRSGEGPLDLLQDCDAELNPTVARSPAPAAFHLHRCLQSCGQRVATHAPQGTLPTPMASRHRVDVENTPLPDSSGMLHVEGSRCPWGETRKPQEPFVTGCRVSGESLRLHGRSVMKARQRWPPALQAILICSQPATRYPSQQPWLKHCEAGEGKEQCPEGVLFCIDFEYLAIVTVRMAKTLLPSYDRIAEEDEEEEEEDYIDMDVSCATEMANSTANSFLCYAIVSSPHSNEFEFQMSVQPAESEATAYPADELFYKGKLLPLHLHRRLQMVEKLGKSKEMMNACEAEVAIAPPATPTDRTPFGSCNISPASSCYVSGELDAEDYYYRGSAELVRVNRKSSWSKKLMLIKHLSQSLKLKAPKAYLKSLFNKPRRCQQAEECTDGNAAGARKKPPVEQAEIGTHLFDDTNAPGLMRSINREKHIEEDDVCCRKSFSGAMSWSHTATDSSVSWTSASSSSSSSSSLSGTTRSGGSNQPVLLLNRSSSLNAEVESSIQGAISHCKKSQQMISGRKSASDAGLCSLSAPIIAVARENQEKPGLCRG